MKKTFLKASLILVFTASIVSCKKEFVSVENSCPSTYYYYYFDEKVPLEKSMNTLCLGFNEVYTTEQVSNIIRAYPELKVPIINGVLLASKFTYVAIDGYHTCEDIQNLMTKLKLNQSITFATQSLFSHGDESDRIGLTDQFDVFLKDSSEETRLIAFTKANDCFFYRESKYNNTYFSLKVKKTNAKDALEMSNYFKEVGKFESASPNFLINVKAFSTF